MSSSTVEINGLPLPDALVAAIAAGVWKTPTSTEKLGAVFSLERAVQPTLYGLEDMRRENAVWPDVSEPSYLGERDSTVVPGDIDPRESVLIGDLGPDQLIALDYRSSRDNPRVVYLVGEIESHWVQAAPGVRELLSALGLVVAE